MSDPRATVRRPDRQIIERLAEKHYIDLSEDELDLMVENVSEVLQFYDELRTLPEPARASPDYPRDSGYQPADEEDPHNSFVRKCSVHGSDAGPLDGHDVGVKDNIAVAGVPMTCGSDAFQNFVPERDAVLVERLLDAGATVTGKMNMENMAYSGSGELSATGPVLNPRDEEYLAGGSSSGSAAAVVAGDVDVAIGTDQGGSVRTPSSWCGCVGLKPTHGLVPYTGAMGFGHTFDHAGPIARSVSDCANVLSVIASSSPSDPRQAKLPADEDWEFDLEGAPTDVTVGALEEGFGKEESEPGVDDTVFDALDRFEDASAAVDTVSIPYHLHGLAIWYGVSTEAVAALVRDEGVGHFVRGYYDTQLVEEFAKTRRTRANDFPPTLKMILVTGQYLADEYHGYYHAKAQNLREVLARAYDDALESVDVLALPTNPQTAHRTLEDPTTAELLDRSGGMLANVAPFNVTGHPVITVPCGTDDGLPVGLSFVGERFDDETVLRVARAFERHVYDIDYPS